MRRVSRRCAALAFLACALAFGLAALDFYTPAAAQQTSLGWAPCGGAMECATLAVPLDYADPNGEAIELALVRQPARDPSRRIGPLLVNPGGPGGSGVELARILGAGLASEIRDRFDIVGFDPRGVRGSTPLLCHDDIQRLGGLEPEPSTDDEWAEVVRANREFTALCAKRGGAMLPHLGSPNVVRDMDRIREALGEEQVSYLGYSYGTVLGALYADQFPGRLRAAVLDGAVDIGLPAEELMAMQAEGFDLAFERFIADCRARECALGDDPAATIDALMERAREQPIPAANADRPAGPGEVQLGVIQSLYRPEAWIVLERAVDAARGSDASLLVRLADVYLGKRGTEYDNSFEMNAAVNCVDYEFSRDIEHYQTTLADTLEERAPHFGRSFAPAGIACALWAAPPQPISLTDTEDAPPVIVIGTTNDPATPYAWALGLRRDLPSSVLLTYEGDGHTIYATSSRCINQTVDRYLLTLETPEDGAICGAADSVPRTPPTPPSAAASNPTVGPVDSTPDGATSSVDGSRGEAWRGYLVRTVIGVAGVALVLAFFISRRRPQRR
jgi:pimeloyl-ACP methyl ester carboxylesterase